MANARFEQFNESGQRLVSTDIAQYVLVLKATQTTAARSEAMGFQFSWRTTFTANHSVRFVAVVCSVPCVVVISGKSVTVHVARGTSVPVTVYCFSAITTIAPAPRTNGGYGIELYNESGAVIYSSQYYHLKIKSILSLYHSAASGSMPALSNVALCVSDHPTNHFYGSYTPEGYWVNNVQRGYQYNSGTGAITSANINISKTQEHSRPIVVGYGYYLSVMLIDVEIINAKYPSSYTMS